MREGMRMEGVHSEQASVHAHVAVCVDRLACKALQLT